MRLTLFTAFLTASLPAAAETCPDTPTTCSISLPEPGKASVQIDLTLASENLLLGNFVANDGVAAASFVENVKIASDGAGILVNHAGGGLAHRPFRDRRCGDRHLRFAP